MTNPGLLGYEKPEVGSNDPSTKAHGEGSSQTAKRAIKTQTSTTHLLLAGIFGSTLTLFIHFITFQHNLVTQSHENIPTDFSSPTTNCGSSPESAQSRGCFFDPVSFSWLSPQCYDAQVTADFLKHNWSWYELIGDPVSATPHQRPHAVQQDIALSGEQLELYVTDEYHIVHCIYMWRKLHRGLDIESKKLEPMSSEGAWIDSYTRNFMHTHHCTDVLLLFVRNMHASQRQGWSESEIEYSGHSKESDMGEDLELVRTTITTKYPDCPLRV